MLTTLLPLVAFVVGSKSATPSPTVDKVESAKPEKIVVASPRAAQSRLAEILAEADSIEAVSARGRDITFSIVERGETMRLVARTTKRGTISSLSIVKTHEDTTGSEVGAITWLGMELASAAAITKLVVDEDGGILLTTSDQHRFMVIPGRGSGGANVAVESRWAGAWSGEDES